MRVIKALARWAIVGCWMWTLDGALACSVPVFRYALERWQPSPYRVVVFHRGPLSATGQRLAASLATNMPPANVTVEFVDVSSPVPPELETCWKQHERSALPLITVHYPIGSAARGETFAGPLDEATVRRVRESPARREIARRILRGDCAVWVLLESGVRSVDDATARRIEARLRHLENVLTLPKVAAEDLAQGLLSVPESQLKVAFSLVRVSRQDPAEQVLVRMLRGSEDDLHEERQPMAFPVFGRGRALFALVGEGIGEEMIDEACSFVIGPCSCVVKEENPGLDLLFAEDWDGGIGSPQVQPHATPELTGLTAAPVLTNSPAGATLGIGTNRAEAWGASPRDGATTNRSAGAAVRPAPALVRGLLLWTLVVLAGVGLASLFLARQRH